MEISPLESLDPYLALAATQATRQPPFPTPSTQLDQGASKAVAAVSTATTPAIQADAFGALLQQASTLASPAPKTMDPTSAPVLINPVDQAPAMAALGTVLDNATTAGSSLLADPFGTLLQQAYLSPLASNLFANPAQNLDQTADELAKRDITATTAISAIQPSSGEASSNLNERTLIPWGAESYLVAQQQLKTEGAFGSLDLMA